jgi:hypothetical protein
MSRKRHLGASAALTIPQFHPAQVEQRSVGNLILQLPEAKRGFVLLPRRWGGERSFAWAARFRRLARDDERLPKRDFANGFRPSTKQRARSAPRAKGLQIYSRKPAKIVAPHSIQDLCGLI